MGATTTIQYLNPNGKTFNPWVGCTKTSPGCEHCFAERWAKRTGMVEWGPGKPRRRTSESYWKQPLKWNKQAEKEGIRYRVLTDLCDPFDPDASDEWRLDYFWLINHTSNLTWLVLTKRIKFAKVYLNTRYPLPQNVWLGITVCNQEEADRDIPILLSIPAAKHWLSIEPILEYIWLPGTAQNKSNIDWVVAGCESGPKARPAEENWFRVLLGQCGAQKIPFYLKQMMVNGKLVSKPELYGQKWEQIPE